MRRTCTTASLVTILTLVMSLLGTPGLAPVAAVRAAEVVLWSGTVAATQRYSSSDGNTIDDTTVATFHEDGSVSVLRKFREVEQSHWTCPGTIVREGTDNGVDPSRLQLVVIKDSNGPAYSVAVNFSLLPVMQITKTVTTVCTTTTTIEPSFAAGSGAVEEPFLFPVATDPVIKLEWTRTRGNSTGDPVNTMTTSYNLSGRKAVVPPAGNQSPRAVNDLSGTIIDTPSPPIPVLMNDKDPDGDLLRVEVVGVPNNGSALITDTNTTVTYMPRKGFVGVDIFRYRVSDGRGGSAEADVTVVVTPAPQVDLKPREVCRIESVHYTKCYLVYSRNDTKLIALTTQQYYADLLNPNSPGIGDACAAGMTVVPVVGAAVCGLVAINLVGDYLTVVGTAKDNKCLHKRVNNGLWRSHDGTQTQQDYGATPLPCWDGPKYLVEGAEPKYQPQLPQPVDVSADYWAQAQIQEFAARGITTGCGAGDFCPARGVTRAEMAVFVDRTLGYGPLAAQARAAAFTFADVPADYWAYGYIEQFATLGITTGCGGGDFCPARGVTRAEMAAFLIRASQGSPFTPAIPATPTFADVPVNHPQYGYIEALVKLGVTTGCGTDERGQRLYCPDRGVTRAEMAVFIIRAFP